MNDFVAKDTCVICNEMIGVVFNKKLGPVSDGPHSLSLCTKCKQRLTNEKMLLVIEIVKNKKGQITRVTGRAAEMSEEALKESTPNYKKIMEDRVITVDRETFDYLNELGNGNGEA